MNLEFFIRMRDMMSGGLAKLANNAKSAFGKVENQVNRVTGRNKLLSASFDEISNRIRQTEAVISRSRIPAEIRAARKELEQLQRMANNHSGNTRGAGRPTGGGGGMGFGGMMRGAIPMALIAGALSFGAGALTDGLQAQARSKSFEVMAGKEAGGALNKDLTKYAQDSIYGNEVFQNAQTMMGMGIAAKDVMPDMKMLGDVAMGDANKLNALTYAFSQVAAGQKLVGNDMIQFTNAGFNPLQIISEQTGESYKSLKDKMSEGLITFDMVKGAFKAATSEGGRFYKMTEQIANTDFGKVQAFKGQLEGLSTRIGGILAPAIGALITNFLTPLLNLLGNVAGFMEANVFPMFENMPIGDFFNTILESGKNMMAALLPVFDALKPVFLTLFEVLGPIFMRFVEFQGFIAAKLGPTIANLAKIFSFYIIPVLKITGWLIQSMFDLFSKLIGWIAPVLEWFTGVMAGIAEKVGVLLGIDPNNKDANTKNKVTLDEVMKNKPKPTDPATPTSANAGDMFAGLKSGGKSGGEDAVKGVTSGGPRVINIHINKMVEKIEVHAASFEKGIDSVQDQLEEVLLRILNSGAALQ